MQPLGELRQANSGPLNAGAVLTVLVSGQIIIRNIRDMVSVTGWPALTVPRMVLTQTARTLQGLYLEKE